MPATIISLMPFASEENKPSLVPPIFHIPACPDDKDPTFVQVQDCLYVEYIPLKGSRHQKITALDVARAIVNDKLNSIFGRDPEKKALPGLAAVEGEVFTLSQLEKRNPGVYAEMLASQRRWYEHLIFLADDDWTKYRQHKIINDLQRHAAKALGLNREWAVNLIEARNTACPVCKELINSEAIKCRYCGEIIDKVTYAKFTTLPKE